MLSSYRCAPCQVEKDEEYIKSVTALGAVIEDLVKANNAEDIYEEYFAGKNVSQSAQCNWQSKHACCMRAVLPFL